MTEREIFLAAFGIPDAPSRSVYLDGVCGGDTARRARVEALLRSHEEAGSFLGLPAVGSTDSDAAQTMAFQTTGADPDRAEGSGDSLTFLSPAGRADSLGRIGHYEVLQILGRGGFGIVFRAFDDVLQRVVAVKALAPQMAGASPARKRFLREARSSAAIRHENVVQVYAIGETPLPYIVMEFIPGETLQDVLDRDGPLEIAETLRIGTQVARELAAAHALGLVHRDVKPANILLEGGLDRRAKLTDFGLARAADDASITQSGVIAGTPLFMAPEQARGEPVDHRADLFSLGSVLYTMVSGRPPFRAPTTLAVLKRVCDDDPRPLPEIIPETPAWLCDLIAKMHAKDPAARFESAKEVADLLAEAPHAEPPAVRKAFRPASARAGRRWFALGAGLAALLVVIAAGALGYFALTWPGTTDQTKTTAPTPPVPSPASADTDGFVPLFNGKDLTGWRPAEWATAEWKVEDGNIVSNGHTWLASAKKYKDFHWRLEAKANAGAWCSLMLRAADGVVFSTVIAPGHSTGRGGLWVTRDGKSVPHFTPDKQDWAVADTWLTLDVIAVGKNVTVLINGIKTTDMKVDDIAEAGELRIGSGSKETVMTIRKIEIKELPASLPAADKDGFVSLFNGKDLTGWKNADWATAHWKVVDGNLVGDGHSWLFHEKEYGNFHWRTEVKVNAGAWGSLEFRKAGGRSCSTAIMPGFNTGGLWASKEGKNAELFKPKKEDWAIADTWLTVEVVAVGKRVTVLIDGTKTTDMEVDEIADAGQLWLVSGSKETVMTVRKIEIKELPPTPTADKDGFVPLFNGKDLTGWKKASWAKSLGAVEDGKLVLKDYATLLSDGDFGNCHVRLELKVNADGWARLGVRDAPGGYASASFAPRHLRRSALGSGAGESALPTRRRGRGVWTDGRRGRLGTGPVGPDDGWRGHRHLG